MIEIKESNKFRVIGKSMNSVLPSLMKSTLFYFNRLKIEVVEPIWYYSNSMGNNSKSAEVITDLLRRGINDRSGRVGMYIEMIEDQSSYMSSGRYKFHREDSVTYTLSTIRNLFSTWYDLKVDIKHRFSSAPRVIDPEVMKVFTDFESKYDKSMLDTLRKAMTLDKLVNKGLSDIKLYKMR